MLSACEAGEVFALLEGGAGGARAAGEALSALYGAVREPWLVRALLQYHARTGSARALDLLARAPDPHARHLLDALAEQLRAEPAARRAALAALAPLVARRPAWLHRLAPRDLLRAARLERDPLPLLHALLALAALLPAAPALAAPHWPELADALLRPAALDPPPSAATRAHLQLAQLALFHALYATHPCTLLDTLRGELGAAAARDAWERSLRPLLHSVRLHPALLTGSRRREADAARRLEEHDVVAGLALVCAADDPPAPAPAPPPAPGPAPRPPLAAAALRPGAEPWFALAERCGESAPHTPLPLEAEAEGEPPEAAVEATPENTPAKETRAAFRFPSESSAVRAIGRPEETSPAAGAEGAGRLRRVLEERRAADSPVAFAGAPPPPPPGALRVEPGALRVEPGALRVEPGALRVEPGALRVEPGALRVEPGALRVEPGALRVEPGALRVEPGALRVEPGALRVEPGALRVEPGALRVEPGAPPAPPDDPLDSEVRELTAGGAAGDAWPEPGGWPVRAPDPRRAAAPLPPPARAPPRARAPAPAPARRAASCPPARAQRADAAAQTVDTWPEPYEFLIADFYRSLPDDEQAGESRDPALPCERLDAYLSELYAGGGGGGGGGGGAARGELAEQLALAHAQLMYERWRREAHAERNRRLLGRCRQTRALELQAAALRERLRAASLERDELRAHLARLRAASPPPPPHPPADRDIERRLEAALQEQSARAARAEAELWEERARRAQETRELQAARAAGEEAARRGAGLARAALLAERRAEHVRRLRRELLVLAEREARLRDLAAAAAAAPADGTGRLAGAAGAAGAAAAAERRALQALCARAEGEAASSAARADAAAARAHELDAALAVRDAVVAELKRNTRHAAEEHAAQLRALQDKYEALLRVVRAAEVRQLQQLAARPLPARALRPPPRDRDRDRDQDQDDDRDHDQLERDHDDDS